jgi:hypothetical protein
MSFRYCELTKFDRKPISAKMKRGLNPRNAVKTVKLILDCKIRLTSRLDPLFIISEKQF